MLIASAWLFYKVMQAMNLPAYVGWEALVGQEVEEVAQADTPCRGRYLVRHRGELWSALSEGRLRPGQRARIVGFEGATPSVEPVDGGPPAATITDRRQACH